MKKRRQQKKDHQPEQEQNESEERIEPESEEVVEEEPEYEEGSEEEIDDDSENDEPPYEEMDRQIVLKKVVEFLIQNPSIRPKNKKHLENELKDLCSYRLNIPPAGLEKILVHSEIITYNEKGRVAYNLDKIDERAEEINQDQSASADMGFDIIQHVHKWIHSTNPLPKDRETLLKKLPECSVERKIPIKDVLQDLDLYGLISIEEEDDYTSKKSRRKKEDDLWIQYNEAKIQKGKEIVDPSSAPQTPFWKRFLSFFIMFCIFFLPSLLSSISMDSLSSSSSTPSPKQTPKPSSSRTPQQPKQFAAS